jgi:hypothetical protein
MLLSQMQTATAAVWFTNQITIKRVNFRRWARFFFAIVTAFVKYKRILITARQNLRQYKKQKGGKAI